MRIDPKKIFVIPLAPVSATGNEGRSAEFTQLAIPDRYIIYPAASWPHKNHHRLFQALALIRDRGIDIPLILTGPRPRGVDLVSLAITSGVNDLVFDLGYLPQTDVEALIANSVAMVVPTLFEAASFPVWEAFRLGTPVACSNVTSLPRQVGGCGLLFDPRRMEAIADAIGTLWGDPCRREKLAELGRECVTQFSWGRTARHLLALYRYIGGRRVSDADKDLLEQEPLL
jgi:glycosyltransferase involved in cell wall biosynthesis